MKLKQKTYKIWEAFYSCNYQYKHLKIVAI